MTKMMPEHKGDKTNGRETSWNHGGSVNDRRRQEGAR